MHKQLYFALTAAFAIALAVVVGGKTEYVDREVPKPYPVEVIKRDTVEVIGYRDMRFATDDTVCKYISHPTGRAGMQEGSYFEGNINNKASLEMVGITIIVGSDNEPNYKTVHEVDLSIMWKSSGTFRFFAGNRPWTLRADGGDGSWHIKSVRYQLSGTGPTGVIQCPIQ